jgi:hypothetical protein
MSGRFPFDQRNERATVRDTTELFGEPISVYTRAQALADGVLVDVTAWASSGPDGMLGGFSVPVAIPRALWAVIDIDHGRPEAAWHTRVRARGESTRGRAHDVVWLAAVAARRSPDSQAVRYSVLMTVEGKSGRLVQRTVSVEARLDGDGVTIGFPEDF